MTRKITNCEHQLASTRSRQLSEWTTHARQKLKHISFVWNWRSMQSEVIILSEISDRNCSHFGRLSYVIANTRKQWKMILAKLKMSRRAASIGECAVMQTCSARSMEYGQWRCDYSIVTFMQPIKVQPKHQDYHYCLWQTVMHDYNFFFFESFSSSLNSTFSTIWRNDLRHMALHNGSVFFLKSRKNIATIESDAMFNHKTCN